jgi:hypothetical protein
MFLSFEREFEKESAQINRAEALPQKADKSRFSDFP